MRYDRGDSFPFDFEPDGTLFGSKWNQIQNFLSIERKNYFSQEI